MIALEMLDVVIGLVFIYLLLSLICTAVNEFIEGFIKLRAVDLEQGIRELLNDQNATDLVPKIYNHQLIYSLFRGNYNSGQIRNLSNTAADSKKKRYSRGSDLPSYVPSRNFALALMDVLLPPSQSTPVATSNLNLSGSSATLAAYNDNLPAETIQPIKPNPLIELRNAVSIMQNIKVKEALLTIIDAAGDDAVKAREGIENWYNSSMDRVAGWYKRRVQQIVFIMGFVIAVTINADSIAIFKNLANDRPLRNAIVAQAQSFKDISGTDTTAFLKIKNNTNTLLNMGLPIGWGWKSSLNPNAVANSNAIPEASFINWFLKIIGWLITGFAISLGAPFWFDLLNKIMVVRSTIKPHEKSQEESSKDS